MINIKDELIKYKDYFDNMYKSIDPNILLDDEQRIAILNDCKYNMIIAGAGCGKTLCIGSKVKFLVDIKKIRPRDIVIISFTNKAVIELKERINNLFKIDTKILTFHKLGLTILNDDNYKILSDFILIIKEYIKINLYCDNKLLKQISNYFNKYLNIPNYIFLFKSINSYLKLLELFNIKKEINYFDNFIYYLSNILSKLKTNQINIDYFKSDLIKNFINDLYNYYQNKLKENNYLDFDDIIEKAYLKLDEVKLNYKYIIVDEYQDISYQRFKLIKKISELCDCKVVVVGDDFQTIYSFSGSDINLFYDFKKMFNPCSVCKITRTYRNSKELINIAGLFVMKNELQIKKELKSDKCLQNPISIIYYKNRVKSLNKCLSDINKNYKTGKILLLGRYNFDIKFYIGKYFKCENGKIKSIKYPNLDITFLSVHSSKGLGFDNVIILNCNDEVYGFPAKQENTDILEERRLFYVALTRTKNKVYILADINKPSLFLKEIN